MAAATRASGDEEDNGEGGKSDGTPTKRAMARKRVSAKAARAMAMARKMGRATRVMVTATKRAMARKRARAFVILSSERKINM